MKPMLESLIGQGIDAIDTPALVLDLDAMQRNLVRMTEFAKTHKIKLRPHAKMHKSGALALMQIEAGAVGVCVQKTSEAEALAQAGVSDIYISNEVIAPHKLQRVATLARTLDQQGGRLAIAADSLLGVQNLAAAFALSQPAAGATAQTLIDVFIEVDVGHGRCGVNSPPVTLAIAQAISKHPKLRFAGLQAYQGRAQHLRSVLERQLALQVALKILASHTQLLTAHGLPPALITGAGSGTFAMEAASGVYGELQVGSFMFMDADYASNQADPAQPEFEHALFIKTQIMSRSQSHAVCDAGHKSHAIDSGLPSVLGQALDYLNGGDEHGIIKPRLPGKPLPELGDMLWLIPGHCDPTVNLHNFLIGIRGGLVEGRVTDIIAVDSRGALT
jgi:D-serine deaminase-like pyridoxal phosphate-dependent protein